MAARKRTIDEATAEAIATRAGTVVLEQMQGHFRAFGESLDGLRERMEQRFDGVEQRFDRVEQRLDRVERVVHEHERQLRDVQAQLGDVHTQLRDMNAQLGDLRVAVDRKVDRDEVEGIVERAVGRVVGH